MDGVIDLRDLIGGELNVDDGAEDLSDGTSGAHGKRMG
jgi:hypothetical protein